MTRALRTVLLSLLLGVCLPSIGFAQEHGDAVEHEPHAINWWAHLEGAEAPPPLGWQILDTLVMVGLIAYMARKPMAQFLGKRRSDIAEQLAEAQRMKAAAEAKFADAKRRMDALGDELEKLKEEIVRSGEAERDRIVAEAEQKAARLRKDAEFVMEQRVKQLRVELRGEMVEAAVAAAQKVLVERTTDADQERLAKEFVAKLGPLAKQGKVQQ